jgi:hypothetical protein
MLNHTRHVDEELGKAAEGVWDGLPPERNGRDETVLDTLWVRGAIPPTRRGLVRLVAEHGVADSGKGTKEKAGANTSNRAIVNPVLAEQRVEAVLGARLDVSLETTTAV